MDSRRHQPPLALNTNPLVFALGQVVISPVLRMNDYVPEVQERFRREGFPRFSRLETHQLRLTGDQSELVRDIRWAFADRANRTAVVLSPNFLVLEQTTYTTFDAFANILAQAIGTIHDVVDVDLCERFGFRRVNLIYPADSGMSLREFFQAGLRGVDPQALGVGRLEAQLEERGQTPAGDLVVRLIKPAPESGLPPDLMATSLEHVPAPPGPEHALLDIDHYAPTQQDFVPDGVVDAFWELHRYSDSAFRAAVTNEALEYWRREKAQ